MSRKEPRQLKELRNLMPFAWDVRKEKHPPGVASMRDFQNCLQFSFKQRHSPTKLADIGQRKRRKKVVELKAPVAATTESANLARNKQVLSDIEQKSTQGALNNNEVGLPSSPRLKDSVIGTPSMPTHQQTPGSGVSEMTPACRTGVSPGHIPNTMPSHLSTGMVLSLSPAVAGDAEGTPWQESPPVPMKLLEDASPDEGDQGSEPICTSIMKSLPQGGSLMAAGEAAGHQEDQHDSGADSGKERAALQSLTGGEMETVHSADGCAQLDGNGKENMDPIKDPEQACISADGVRPQGPQQGQCQCGKSNLESIAHLEPLQTCAPTSSGASPTDEALLEIKALDVQCTSDQPLSRPVSALAESRTLPLCTEPIQICPPLFRSPLQQKLKKGRPASTGRRSRPSSAVSVGQQATQLAVTPRMPHHTPERLTPAGRDAFLFASAVMVLGGQCRVERKHTRRPQARLLRQRSASPLQAPCSSGSLLQACAMLTTQDAAAGWTSY